MIIKKILPILLTGILFFGIGMAAASGADTTPGSEADPLVSKSYVDGKTSYVPLQLQPGQSLIGDEGTEIILRSGEGTAIDNGANGVSDISSGRDLMSGMKVELNHLLLVPRADGRGIKVSTEAWVLIRGSYTIR
jgi:hypothetical protein